MQRNSRAGCKDPDCDHGVTNGWSAIQPIAIGYTLKPNETCEKWLKAKSSRLRFAFRPSIKDEHHRSESGQDKHVPLHERSVLFTLSGKSCQEDDSHKPLDATAIPLAYTESLGFEQASHDVKPVGIGQLARCITHQQSF
jgi:hypothetical protein